jgi:hypothetical protein
VLICLNERSLSKKHSVLILKVKEKLLALKEHEKDIKCVWIPCKMADVAPKESIRKGEEVQYLVPVTDLKRVAAEEWY